MTISVFAATLAHLLVSPAHAQDCSDLNIAVVGSVAWAVPSTIDMLNSVPTWTATVVDDCSLDVLSSYDAVIIHGNPTCDYSNVDAYVTGGGGLVGIPWVVQNGYAGSSVFSLPVGAGDTSGDNCSPAVPVIGDHPLLDGVIFDGTCVGREHANNPDSAATVVANSAEGTTAVAAWDYGDGTSVYLDFHYYTSDSTPAIGVPWADALLQNSIDYVTCGGGGGGSTSLALDGACPGPKTIEISGNPGDTFVLAAGDSPGSTTVARGVCAGTELGIESAGALFKVGPLRDADGDGMIRIRPDLPGRACSMHMQALNLSDCSTSAVVPVGDGGGGPVAPEDSNICADNPLWQPVDCVTGEWVWSSNRDYVTVESADAARTLWAHYADPNCSLDGTGWVSVDTFEITTCDTDWWHIGGRYTGACGGHNGNFVQRLTMGDDTCWNYYAE